MIDKIFLILFLGAFLGACGTTPKKSEPVPVEDRSGVEDLDTGAEDDAPSEAEGAQAFGAEDDREAAMRQLEEPEGPLSVRIIYFDYDSSAVLPRFNETIQTHANFLQTHPNVTTTLEGHADERGSREYNLALGERRAQAVKQQLTLLGGPTEQIRTVSYGEERSADAGHDQQAWALNRRVEFVY